MPINANQFRDELERKTLNSSYPYSPTIAVTTTSHTATPANRIILVDDDTAAGAVTVTLPPAADENPNGIYHVKKLGTTGNVIVDANAAETIDGALTLTISVQYDSAMIVSDGSNWHII
jgi:hypothetical protein